MSVVCPKGCGSSWSSRCGAFLKRSEEHTSELQSQSNLVCRLLLEKKKNFRESTRLFRAPSLRPSLRHLLPSLSQLLRRSTPLQDAVSCSVYTSCVLSVS